VSPDKPDVARALRGRDAGLFPTAFCRVVPDVLGNAADHCLAIHADGVGTKSIVAHLKYRATGDARVYRSLAQDSLVMNIDDLLCLGTTGPFVVSNTIGRNKTFVDGEILTEIVAGYYQFAERMAAFGVELQLCGGETADLGDLVRTLVIDSTLVTRMARAEVIDAGNVRAGDVIVGLASFGRASYEDAENSGIGTNGFTSARHELLHPSYRQEAPETFDPAIATLAYNGRFHLDDRPDRLGMSIGDALLSPTRTYAPILAGLLPSARREISAMFHNTGGGLTKCLHFGNGVRYVKDDLFDTPEIFELIRRNRDLPAREMIRVFNLGQRFEIVCRRDVASDIIDRAQSFGVAAKIIGRVEASTLPAELVVRYRGETVELRREPA
jgi:phosphoribosylformylglycinamidine cyclo-ligase